jgi:hypothetical protein
MTNDLMPLSVSHRYKNTQDTTTGHALHPLEPGSLAMLMV